MKFTSSDDPCRSFETRGDNQILHKRRFVTARVCTRRTVDRHAFTGLLSVTSGFYSFPVIQLSSSKRIVFFSVLSTADRH